jgi:hypothetical protein
MDQQATPQAYSLEFTGRVTHACTGQAAAMRLSRWDFASGVSRNAHQGTQFKHVALPGLLVHPRQHYVVQSKASATSVIAAHIDTCLGSTASSLPASGRPGRAGRVVQCGQRAGAHFHRVSAWHQYLAPQECEIRLWACQAIRAAGCSRVDHKCVCAGVPACLLQNQGWLTGRTGQSLQPRPRWAPPLVRAHRVYV